MRFIVFRNQSPTDFWCCGWRNVMCRRAAPIMSAFKWSLFILQQLPVATQVNHSDGYTVYKCSFFVSRNLMLPSLDWFRNSSNRALARFKLVLVWYIGECMISLMIDINNGIKELTHGYQNCNTNQIMIFGGYLKAWESLYTQVIIWSIPF